LLVAAVAVPFAAFAAPGRTIRAEIVAVHQLPGDLSGARFAFVPTPEQAASPEFMSFQDLVRQRLISHGLAEVAFADADLAVGLICIAAKGQPAQGVPQVSAEASFGANTRGNVDAATGAPIISSTLTPMYAGGMDPTAAGYTRRVTLMLYAVKPVTAGKPREVYEGTATSLGASNELGPVAPKLIDALFADFPGKSGVARTAKLACPDCTR
jgi:hypothetical protein